MPKITFDIKYSTAIDHLQPRQILVIEHEEKEWILCRVDDDIYIMHSRCPHAGAALTEGACNARGVVVCPLHGYKFDITKGHSADGHQYKFKSYKLKKSIDFYYFEQ